MQKKQKYNELPEDNAEFLREVRDAAIANSYRDLGILCQAKQWNYQIVYHRLKRLGYRATTGGLILERIPDVLTYEEES